MRGRFIMSFLCLLGVAACLTGCGEAPKPKAELVGTWESVSKPQASGGQKDTIETITYEFTVGMIKRRVYVRFPSEEALKRVYPEPTTDRVTRNSDGTVSYVLYYGIAGYELQVDPAGRLFTPFGDKLLKITKLANGNIIIDDGKYTGEYRKVK